MKSALFLMVALSAFAVVFALPSKFLDDEDTSFPDLSELVDRMAPKCGGGCRFEFCDGKKNIIIGAPDIHLTDSICKKDGTNIGVVGQTGQAKVKAAGSSLTKISKYSPAGLNQNFSPSFFKAFSIPMTGTSGVGHEVPQQNQNKFLDNLCVVLPLRSYQKLNGAGALIDNVHTSDPKDCIKFTTTVPKLLFELTWNTADDLDLHVIEPNGFEIFFGDRVSPVTGGELLEDDNVGICGTTEKEDGLERVFYASDGALCEEGEYTIRAQHWNNCGNGKTHWRLRIFEFGKLKVIKSGTSNMDGNAIIHEIKFDFEGH